jgi:hypothetical protein
MGGAGGAILFMRKVAQSPLPTLGSGGLDSGSPPSGRVILVGFDANNLAPLTQSGLLAYARLWNYDGSGLPQPPVLYPVVVGDTLYIAWSDGRPVGVPTGAGEVVFNTFELRIYVMGWAGLSTYGSSWSAFGAGWPAYTISRPSPGPCFWDGAMGRYPMGELYRGRFWPTSPFLTPQAGGPPLV